MPATSKPSTDAHPVRSRIRIASRASNGVSSLTPLLDCTLSHHSIFSSIIDALVC